MRESPGVSARIAALSVDHEPTAIAAKLVHASRSVLCHHVSAFAFFGGVPQSVLYDNTRLAVAKIVKGGKRLRSHMFAELQSHYLFVDRFGKPLGTSLRR